MPGYMHAKSASDPVSQLRAQGLAAMDARNPAAAEKYFRQALKFGETAGGLQDLAQARAMQGDFFLAKQLYARALRLAPDSAVLHCNYARMLFVAGDVSEAVAELNTVVARHPDYAAGQLNLGMALFESGAKAEAREPLRRAAQMMPDASQVQYYYGLACLDAGDLAAARPAFEKVLELNPDDVPAMVALGECYLELTQGELALQYFDYALKLQPDSRKASYGRCVALVQVNRAAEAVPAFRKFANTPKQKLALARALLVAGEVEDACQIYAALVNALPEDPRAANGYADALVELGRLDEAYAAYIRAIELAPERPAAYHALLSMGKSYPLPPAQRASLMALAARAEDLPATDRSEVLFTLYRLYARQGDDDAAIRSLLEANAAKRALLSYDEAGRLARMAKLVAATPKSAIQNIRKFGVASDVPVFIVGMLRSGTSLTEQILSSHRDVYGAGEIADFTNILGEFSPGKVPQLADMTADDVHRIASAYLDRLHQLAPDARRVVDKLPWNFQLIGYIHALFPNARIIHTIRDPMATCFSCFEQNFSGDIPFYTNLTELGHYYRAYAKMMAHWREVLPPGVMLELHYENLVTNFETEARRLIAYCGLDWDPACLKFYRSAHAVRTVSATQVRQPVYTSSVGRWKRYEKALAPLADALSGVDQFSV